VAIVTHRWLTRTHARAQFAEHKILPEDQIFGLIPEGPEAAYVPAQQWPRQCTEVQQRKLADFICLDDVTAQFAEVGSGPREV
jgi:hypothetical protein